MKRALEMLLYESKATVVLALRVERPAKCWQVKWHRAVSVFICEDAFFISGGQYEKTTTTFSTDIYKK